MHPVFLQQTLLQWCVVAFSPITVWSKMDGEDNNIKMRSLTGRRRERKDKVEAWHWQKQREGEHESGVNMRQKNLNTKSGKTRKQVRKSHHMVHDRFANPEDLTRRSKRRGQRIGTKTEPIHFSLLGRSNNKTKLVFDDNNKRNWCKIGHVCGK